MKLQVDGVTVATIPTELGRFLLDIASDSEGSVLDLQMIGDVNRTNRSFDVGPVYSDVTATWHNEFNIRCAFCGSRTTTIASKLL